MPGDSVGRDQLTMAAKVRRHWFNPCRLGSRGHLGADFSLLLYTDLIKKRKPSRYIRLVVPFHLPMIIFMIIRLISLIARCYAVGKIYMQL